jgi:hypothetical protein
VKIVLTCGHPRSGYWLAHEALVAAGLAPARPSQRESLSPTELHEKICAAHGAAPAEGAVAQLSPGKVWQNLAADLFMGNLAEAGWGWADANMACLLDFWRDFDPQVRFVLAYAAPEYAACRPLLEAPAADGEVRRAVHAWTAFNAELLRFYQRNPDRCLLVNTVDVARAPGRFVETAAAAFGLGLGRLPADYQAGRAGFSAVEAVLARDFASGYAEAQDLYFELEKTADLSGAETAALGAEKRQAWREYAGLVADFAQARRDAEGLAGQLAGAESSLAAGQAEIANLRSRNAARAEESGLLLSQLHQAQEELEHCLLARQALEGAGQSLAKARAESAKALEAARAESAKALEAVRAESAKALGAARAEAGKALEAAQAQLRQARAERDDGLAKLKAQQESTEKSLAEARRQAEARAAEAAEQKKQAERLAQERDGQARRAAELEARLGQAAAEQAGAAALQSRNAELAQENKLLLLQLVQVQEQLEHYFQQSQALEAQWQQGQAQLASRAGGWYDCQPAEVVFDLRRELAGDNWYHAEADGRWAGPEDASTLALPPLAAGRYALELDIVDAMAPDILHGMEVSFNGTPLETRLSGEGYPARVSAQFDADGEPAAWALRLKFPRLICPADTGSDDGRRLAVRLRSLRLGRLDALL